MIAKTLIAVAAVAALAAGASAPANAKVKVDLYLGGYAPDYYEPGYPIYDAPVRPHHPRYVEPRGYGISCEEGRQEVSYAGFRKVRPINCSGKRFSYKARKHGDAFIVRVSRRSGDIISVEPAY